ncbi:MAG: hypothetical protein LBJ31_11375 [Treponema sp.]|nr:hypothetical protein [Treponema sp.]
MIIFTRKLNFKIFAAALLFTLVSCSAQISATLAADASAGAELNASIGTQTAALIRSLAAVSARGADSGAAAPVLDGPALSRSLSRSPGITQADLRNRTPERIAGTIKIGAIGDLLAADRTAQVTRQVFRYDAAGRRLAIHFDRTIAPKALLLLSAEASDYLSALMAPAATGEALGKTEYRALVRSIYGEAIAAEIDAGKITVTLTLPGQVLSSKGGSFQGRVARFEIPLIDLLVLEQAIDYEVTWQ